MTSMLIAEIGFEFGKKDDIFFLLFIFIVAGIVIVCIVLIVVGICVFSVVIVIIFGEIKSITSVVVLLFCFK